MFKKTGGLFGRLPTAGAGGAALTPAQQAKLAAQPNAIVPGLPLVGGRTYVYGGQEYVPPADITYPSTGAIAAAIADDSLPKVGSGGGLTPVQQMKLDADQPLKPITFNVDGDLDSNVTRRWKIDAGADVTLTIIGDANEVLIQNNSIDATLQVQPATTSIEIPPYALARLVREDNGSFIWPE